MSQLEHAKAAWKCLVVGARTKDEGRALVTGGPEVLAHAHIVGSMDAVFVSSCTHHLLPYFRQGYD